LASPVKKSLITLKWPIVVDWTSGHASAEDSEGVKDLLEYLGKKKVMEEEEYKLRAWFL
jgi:hypothetical protein